MKKQVQLDVIPRLLDLGFFTNGVNFVRRYDNHHGQREEYVITHAMLKDNLSDTMKGAESIAKEHPTALAQ